MTTNPGTFITTAPGRVNLLGEHVDYNDGIVMPAAIDRYVHLKCQPISGKVLLLNALDFSRSVTIPLDHLAEKIDIKGQPLPSFALYPAGVAWALIEEGCDVPGLEVDLTSNVPIGAGLSSSAAVEVAFAISWQHISNSQISKMRLAQLCQKAENDYVGVHSGLMDQFASMFGEAGHVLTFDTRDLSWNSHSLPGNTSIVVADSTVRRTLSGSAYNDRRHDCQQALAILQQHLPGIKALRDVTIAEFQSHAHLLDRGPRLRAQHVVEEIVRVSQAVDYLGNNNAAAFGQLMFACHGSLRDLYEVSCPELDALVEIASVHPGCLGARLTGAGFGGCTVNLVRNDAVQDFLSTLSSQYKRITGKDARVYHCQAVPGAAVIDR